MTVSCAHYAEVMFCLLSSNCCQVTTLLNHNNHKESLGNMLLRPRCKFCTGQRVLHYYDETILTETVILAVVGILTSTELCCSTLIFFKFQDQV